MSNFTTEQLSAINARGNVLVSASAGSGKTTVMIERIMQIVLSQEAEVTEILATTFTKLAADQIKEKLARAIKKQLPFKPELKKQLDAVAYSNISTIHSFCGNLLRSYFYLLGIDANFGILEGANKSDFVRRAINNVFSRYYEEKNEDFLELVKTYLTKRKDEEFKNIILSLYNFIITEADPQGYLEKAQNLYTKEGLSQLGLQIYNELTGEILEIKDNLLQLKKDCVAYEKLSNHIDILVEDINGFIGKEFVEINDFLLNYKFAKSPNKNEDDENYSFLLDKVKSCKDALKDIYADFIRFYGYIYNGTENYFALGESFKKLSKMVLAFKDEYDFLKREANVLDFNDLEHYAIKLLKNEEIAKEIRNKFKFIFVDEYQDVNHAQEYIIKTLENNNLFLVGDIKQSIYDFRGCDSKLFLQTQKEFIKNGNGINLQLNKNFRSAKNVIDSVNKIFSTILTEKGGCDYKNNPMVYGDGFDENCGLSTVITHYDKKEKKEREEIFDVYDVDEQLLFGEEDEGSKEGKIIASTIKSLIGKKYYSAKDKKFKTIGFEDIVILSRKLNDGAQKIVEEVAKNGIRISVDNKKDRIVYPEIEMLKDLLIVVNSHGENDKAMLSGLRWIASVTDEEMVQIRLNCPDKKIGFAKAVALYDKDDLIGKKLQEFYKILSSLILTSSVGDASDVVSALIAKTDLEARLGVCYYGQDKINRLYKFLNLARGYSLEEYIEKLELDEFVFTTVSSQEDCVKMMTIHGSKGLEFPIVILCGCGNPHLFKDLYKELIFDREIGVGMKFRDVKNKVIYAENALIEFIKRRRKKSLIQEEIRLLYVALTRAEYHLFMVGKTKELKKQILSFEIDRSNKYLDYIKEGDLAEKEVETFFESEDKDFLSREVIISPTDQVLVKAIKARLDFVYPKSEIVPLKTSVSDVSFKESKIYDINLEFGESSAEKGSAYHKFLELWDFKENFKEFYEGKAKALMGEDYNLLEIEKLEKICSMEVFSLIKDYKLYKEKQFFVGVNYDLISDSKSRQEVVVQGVIDLLAIKKNKAIIIDYKLSTIANLQDLEDKYKKQLWLYAYAVKKLLKLNCECYLINILSQQIIKLPST